MVKERQLELLGLTSKEAQLYLAALPLDRFTVADISRKSGIKRPTCYIILDELTKRGLVSIVPQASKKLYKAASPEALVRQAKHALAHAEKLVPALRSLYMESDGIPQVKFYYGQKGIQNIYEEMLVSKEKMLRYIGSSGPLVEAAGDEFMRDYAKRCVKMGVRRQSIRMRETELADPVYSGTKEMLREIRFAPKDIYIPDTVFVSGDIVAIIATSRGNFGFMIRSEEFAKTILGLFQALWRISSET